jgi:hypothetical protein
MSILTNGSNFTASQSICEVDLYNTAGLGDIKSRFRICTWAAAANYNNTVQNNDSCIIWGNYVGSSNLANALCIVPNQVNTAGLRIQSNGIVNAISFAATSDYRIKDNITELDTSCSCIDLRPIHYRNTGTNKEYLGFLAHEVQEQFPEVVDGEKDEVDDQGNPKLQNLNYSGLIPILVNDIKRLTNELNETKERLKKIEENLKLN